jgi:hypothetical protein
LHNPAMIVRRLCYESPTRELVPGIRQVINPINSVLIWLWNV